MQRIAVIGNAGGGKSTLARALAIRRGLPYVEIDTLL
jgi:adenylate kinase family enzyme